MKFMYCEKCRKNHIIDTTLCPTCNSTLVKSEQGISIVSIICVIVTILTIAALVFEIFNCTSSNYDICLLKKSFVIVIGIFLIPYYLGLTVSSIVLDLKIMKKNIRILKDVVILFLSVGLPVLLIGLPLLLGKEVGVLIYDIVLKIIPVVVIVFFILWGILNKNKGTDKCNNKVDNIEVLEDIELSSNTKVYSNKKIFRWCNKCKKKFDMDKSICPECNGVTKRVKVMNGVFAFNAAVIAIFLISLPICHFLFGTKLFIVLGDTSQCVNYDLVCAVIGLFVLAVNFLLVFVEIILYIFILVSSILIVIEFCRSEKILKEIEKIEK